MSIIRKFDADLADDYEQFAETLFQDGALSKKIKLLAALALDAIKGSSNGVQFFTQEALKAGATWPEIREILRVAYHLGHGGPLWATIRGFSDAEFMK